MIIAPGYRLLIQPDTIEDVDPVYKKAKAAGIYVDENHEDHLRERAGIDKGTVLAVGPTAFREYGGEPWCAVGDHVAYAKHAGKWIIDPDTDKHVLIINDEDVVCVIKKTKEEA